MTFVGADPEQLESLATVLNGFADQLNSTRSDLNARITHSSWRGLDADRFRGDWTSKYIRSLDAAVSSLHAASGTLKDNATQQRSASAVTTGGSVSPSTGSAASDGSSQSGTSSSSADELNRDSMIISSILMLIPGLQGVGALIGLESTERELNVLDPGLGDALGDVIGLFGPLEAVGFATDTIGLVEDMMTGQSLEPDIMSLTYDAGGLIETYSIGKMIGAAKLGVDLGRAISNFPPVHAQMDTYEDWVVKNGETHGGNIGTRYDGPGGVVNLIGDATGLSRYF